MKRGHHSRMVTFGVRGAPIKPMRKPGPVERLVLRWLFGVLAFSFFALLMYACAHPNL